MRAHITLAILILVEILILIMGCHGDRTNPLLPTVTPQVPGTGPSDSLPPTRASGESENDRPPILWSYHAVTYDASSHRIDTVPLRGAAYAFNVIKFLQPPTGYNGGVSIGILDDNDFYQTGRIDIRVILHHPFPGKPVFDGFDVYGIFITEGTLASPANSSLTYSNPLTDPSLLNPDGYTRWMNPTEFLSGDVFGYVPGFWGTSESSENSGFVAGATINPYKYFCQGLSPDTPIEEWIQNPLSVTDRGLFPSGSSCGRDYQLEFPFVDDQMVFKFNYAVTGNWAEPENNPPEDPIEDFPPEANAGWAQHLVVTDNSQCWYVDGHNGGSVSLDIEMLDWDGLESPLGIPGEVSGIVLWSSEPLFPNGYVEFMDTEVEWNSGFTASTSVASVEYDGVTPEHSGEVPVWIEVRSSNPSGYNQGFDAKVPDDPLAAYMLAMIDVKDCPKAGATELAMNSAGSGDYLDDITIKGHNFVEGPDLGAWLELMEAPGSSGDGDPIKIQATDVVFIDESTITVDFNLEGAQYGDYGLGCENGCGIMTTPEENLKINELNKLQVNLKAPIGIQVSTNRHGPAPAALSAVTVSWQPVQDAYLYRIYARFFDINGMLMCSGTLFGTSNYPYKTINVDYLPTGSSGIAEFWVTAVPDPFNFKYESNSSNHAFVYMQDFEIGLGEWLSLFESNGFRFIRSVVDAAYDGQWGLKQYGHPPANPGLWMIFMSPAIADVEGATTVKFEFLHRNMDINEENGYQVGWVYDLPLQGQESVAGYYPIAVGSYGEMYNDTNSLALQQELGCSPTTDNNFQNAATSWMGWVLSGFDVSEILGDDQDNRIGVAFASANLDSPQVCLDDVAIMIY